MPVVYGESSIKYLLVQADPERMCFNMHWHDRMELLLVISGSLMLHSDEGHFEVLPGQVVVTSPKKMHGGFAGCEGVAYHTIMFDIEKFYNATPVPEKYLVPIVKGDIVFPRVICDNRLEEVLRKLVEHLNGEVNGHPLLAEADIYEILGAWKCGYSDVSYFSNCFKKHFGVRPSEIYGKKRMKCLFIDFQ